MIPTTTTTTKCDNHPHPLFSIDIETINVVILFSLLVQLLNQCDNSIRELKVVIGAETKKSSYQRMEKHNFVNLLTKLTELKFFTFIVNNSAMDDEWESLLTQFLENENNVPLLQYFQVSEE
jgi:hypothetical protein